MTYPSLCNQILDEWTLIRINMENQDAGIVAYIPDVNSNMASSVS